MLNRLLVMAAAAGSMLVAAGPAGAAWETGNDTADGTNDGDTVTVDVGTGGRETSTGGGSGGSGSSACDEIKYFLAPGFGGVAILEPVTPPLTYYTLYVGICYRDGEEVSHWVFMLEPGEPGSPVIDTRALAEQATDTLDPPRPEPAFNPDASDPQIVGLATWMWVANWADPEPAEACVAGGSVCATATATATESVWQMGDGTVVTCSAGTPWRPGAEASDCTHTYTTASDRTPAGQYDGQVTVTYEVEWTSTLGDAGSLGTLTRTTPFTLTAEEIQAVGR